MDVTELARAPGVPYVLEGSIAQTNGKLHVTATLVDAVRDEHMWARRCERDMRAIPSAEEEMATAIVHELQYAL